MYSLVNCLYYGREHLLVLSHDLDDEEEDEEK